jgi:F-type H+-transporting ATPase subunit k
MALGTWALVGGSIYAATRGPKNATAPTTPVIPASSADEEKFIQEFLKAAESDSKN